MSGLKDVSRIFLYSLAPPFLFLLLRRIALALGEFMSLRDKVYADCIENQVL